MPELKYIGYKGTTEKYGSFEVLSYEGGGRYKLLFPFTGFTTNVLTKHIKTHAVKDPLYPIVLGVGCVGVGAYKCAGESRSNTPEYEVWRGILRRCHDKNSTSYARYGMRGVTIQSNWYNFQNFAEWYTRQPAYFKRWHLDKDLVDYNTLEYNTVNCTLVPPAINSLFTGGFKTIVPFIKGKGKWVVQIQIGEKCFNGNKRQSYFGDYSDQQEALDAYFKHKIAHVKDVASRYKDDLDERVFANLNNDQWIKDYIYHLSALTNKETL